MIVIGLVGRIGAGKSTVARMFADLGAEVLDADALAHEALADPAVRDEVVARFGAGVRDDDGRISRAALAARVFGPTPEHAAALVRLEAVREAELGDGRRRVAVLDVPLLVQSGWDAACDRLVVVECEDRVRRARLAARGWSPEQVAARDRAWERAGGPAAAPEKSTAVDASGDPAYTRNQVDRFWMTLPAR
jgi:dephospho-CoA kinase